MRQTNKIISFFLLACASIGLSSMALANKELHHEFNADQTAELRVIVQKALSLRIERYQEMSLDEIKADLINDAEKNSTQVTKNIRDAVELKKIHDSLSEKRQAIEAIQSKDEIIAEQEALRDRILSSDNFVFGLTRYILIDPNGSFTDATKIPVGVFSIIADIALLPFEGLLTLVRYLDQLVGNG